MARNKRKQKRLGIPSRASRKLPVYLFLDKTNDNDENHLHNGDSSTMLLLTALVVA